MKIHAQILAGWTHDELLLQKPIWEEAGEFPDLVAATEEMHRVFPGSWLSISIEGFIVHGVDGKQVALLSTVK